MGQKMNTKCILLLVLSITTTIYAQYMGEPRVPEYRVAKESESLDGSAFDHVCPPTYVDCLCETDSGERDYIIQVNLTTVPVVDQDMGIEKCIAEGDPLASCEAHKCIIIPNKNFENLFQKGRRLSPSNYLEDMEDSDMPLVNKTANASTTGEDSRGRVPRDAYGSNTCRVPQLTNSEVTCWKWPNWQTCKQKCIYGHGIESNGQTIREKSYTCRNTENKWNPHSFRDCEPFINCKVHLKSPGDLNCVEPTDGPAYCDINCADYDDYTSHGKVRWKCDEKGMLHGHGKGSNLPHCAEFEEADLRLKAPGY